MNRNPIDESADDEPLLDFFDDIGDLAVPDEYDDAEVELSKMTPADTRRAFEQLLIRAGLATQLSTASSSPTQVDRGEGRSSYDEEAISPGQGFREGESPPSPVRRWVRRFLNAAFNAPDKFGTTVGKSEQTNPATSTHDAPQEECMHPSREGSLTPVFADTIDDLPSESPHEDRPAANDQSETEINSDVEATVAINVDDEASYIDITESRSSDVRKMILGAGGLNRAHDELASLRAEARRLELDLVHARSMVQASLDRTLIADIQADQIKKVAELEAIEYRNRAIDEANDCIQRATVKAGEIKKEAQVRALEKAQRSAEKYRVSAAADARQIIQKATDEACRKVEEAEEFARVLAETVERISHPQTRVEAADPNARHTEFHAVAEQHQMLLNQGEPIWTDPHIGRGSSARIPSPAVPLLRARNGPFRENPPLRIDAWRSGLASARNLAIADIPSDGNSPVGDDIVEVVLALRQSDGWSHWKIVVPSQELTPDQSETRRSPPRAGQLASLAHAMTPFAPLTCVRRTVLPGGIGGMYQPEGKTVSRLRRLHDVALNMQTPAYDFGQNLRWLVAVPVGLVMALALGAPTLWATMH